MGRAFDLFMKIMIRAEHTRISVPAAGTAGQFNRSAVQAPARLTSIRVFIISSGKQVFGDCYPIAYGRRGGEKVQPLVVVFLRLYTRGLTYFLT